MQPKNILIIEDDLVLNDQLASLMQTKGFQTTQFSNGKKALLAALRETFDLILLDVHLPDIDGFSILDKLRKKKQTPVIMLTGANAEHDRIYGYRKGADDYIPKPFNITELILRIEALLRRTQQQADPIAKNHQLVADELILQRQQQQVCFSGTQIELTSTQFKLLWTLVENQHETLSKPYLYQTVLARPFSRYDRSLDMHLSRVRAKLVAAGMPVERLTTVHGKGYLYT